MSNTIKFQIRDNNGAIGSPTASLRNAVLEAAAYDGYGSTYQRDAEGAMRLYSGSRHIGNNPYTPKARDAFSARSSIPDDELAEIDVASQIFKGGLFHSYYTEIEIIKLGYHDDELVSVDGRPFSEIVAEAQDGLDEDEMPTLEQIRAEYE